MKEPIERQAAIDELKRISFSHRFECGEYLSEDTREIEIINSSKALATIEALPPAQPEIVRCKECKYWHREIYNDIEYFNYSSCDLNHGGDGHNFYCADAERRTDDKA